MLTLDIRLHNRFIFSTSFAARYLPIAEYRISRFDNSLHLQVYRVNSDFLVIHEGRIQTLHIPYRNLTSGTPDKSVFTRHMLVVMDIYIAALV